MMRSLWTAASGMRAQQTNVDTIANNIANTNTVSYKSEQASFKSLLYQNLQSTSTNNAGEAKPVPAEVGLGSRLSAISSNFNQGNINPSTSPFSVAIQGDGFFHVKNDSGEDLYTRDGSFIVSPVNGGNELCTSDGYRVMDQNGNAIVLPSTYAATELVIGEDGTISFPDETGNAKALVSDQGYEIKLGLYQFSNPSGLSKTGANNYEATIASGTPIAENNNPNVIASKTTQYYLEASNVDVAEEMVNLIVAQRAYELNSKAIQSSDDMMQQANNLR